MIDFIRLIQTGSSPFLDTLFTIFSALGSQVFYVVIVLCFYWCIDKEKGYRIAYLLFFVTITNVMLKNIFKIPRPGTYSDIKVKDTVWGIGYSFPSGHAQLSGGFYSQFYLLYKNNGILIMGIALMLIISFSRMYLGVHTPVDVSVGLIIGVLSAILIEYSINRLNKKYLMLILIPGLVITIIFKDKDLYALMGVYSAFLVGDFLERKYIKFTTDVSPFKRVLRVFVGFFVLFVMYTIFTLFLPKNILIDLMKYFAIGLSATTIIPMMFAKLKI